MLYQYGINEEQSDIRAHVSLPGRRITVYRTADMVALIASKTYREVSATQPGVSRETARGLLVPLNDIMPQCVLHSEAFPWDRYDHCAMDLAQRGDMAVVVVRASILANKFPLWVCGHVNGDKELDIEGTDLIVIARRRIQVKYDARAYPSSNGGSGNLFVQTHECNPLRIHGVWSSQHRHLTCNGISHRPQRPSDNDSPKDGGSAVPVSQDATR